MMIDGRAIARDIINGLKKRKAPKKALVAVFVGKNAASKSFLREKARIARELHISFRMRRLPGSVSSDALLAAVRRLNRDRKVGGIILQLPLPRKFKREDVTREVTGPKDVDALGDAPRVPAPAALVVQEILRRLRFRARGKRAVVVGRGPLVGGPVAAWLAPRVEELAVFHRNFWDSRKLRRADIVVSGIGRPGILKGRDLKRGALLIDFGYGRKRGRSWGDFDFESCKRIARYLTPTPGGTGPILVAKLFENFYRLS